MLASILADSFYFSPAHPVPCADAAGFRQVGLPDFALNNAFTGMRLAVSRRINPSNL
jgi:hypothetical protein